MRRRRKGVGETSSMELLLDTMCNTFGGIVFITLMIALITSNARLTMQKTPKKIIDSDLADKELLSEINRRKNELQELENSLKIAGDELKIYKDDHILSRSGECLKLQNQLDRQVVAVEDLKRKYMLLYKLLKSEKSTIKNSEGNLDMLRTAVNKLQLELDKAQAIEKVSFTPPVFRSVNKRPIFICIKGKRAYFMSRNKFPYYLIESKCDRKSATNGNIIYIFKDFSGGIPIYPATALNKALRRHLGNNAKNIGFIACEVYQDSFKDFLVFRKVIKSLGYTYNWSPMLMNEFPTLILTHSNVSYRGQ
jgi:hypothetical protein